MKYFNKKLPDYNLSTILFGFILLIIITMLLHDYLTAIVFNQNYNFAESLLYKINVALLLVSVLVYQYLVSRKKIDVNNIFSINININRLLLFLIPIGVIHVLIASAIIAFIAQNFMNSPFTLEIILKKKFTKDFVLLVTIYGLMFLMMRHYILIIADKKTNYTDKITIKTGKESRVISTKDIDWIGAQTPYICIYIFGEKLFYNSTMTHMTKTLDPQVFVRIHRSTIVNVNKIEHIYSRSNGDYDILLYDKTPLRLSRNYSHDLKKTHLKF